MKDLPSAERDLPIGRFAFPFYACPVPEDGSAESDGQPRRYGEMQILYAEAEGILAVGESEYPFAPDGICFVNPQTPHRLIRRSPGPIIRILFDPSALLPSAGRPDALNRLISGMTHGTASFPPLPDPELGKTLLPTVRALASHAGHEIRSGAEVCEILSLLYAFFAACIRANAIREEPEDGRRGPRIVSQVTDMIRERYAESLSVEKLAREAGISPTYLHRVFRSCTGITPAAYIKNVRLQEAGRLLEAGLSVSEAAVAVGFPDTSYFIKLFRAATGMTPLKWIRAKQEGDDPEKEGRLP